MRIKVPPNTEKTDFSVVAMVTSKKQKDQQFAFVSQLITICLSPLKVSQSGKDSPSKHYSECQPTNQQSHPNNHASVDDVTAALGSLPVPEMHTSQKPYVRNWSPCSERLYLASIALLYYST